MLHSELAALYRDQRGGAPSCWKKTFGCRCSSWGTAWSCSLSRYDSRLRKEKGPMIMLHMTPHQTFTFGLSRTCSMTLCCCCDPHIRTVCLFVRKFGSLPIPSSMSQAELCRRGLSWFQLLQNLHLIRIETQPLSENLLQSFSWHLQFPWSPTNWLPWTSDERHTDALYILIGDTLSTSSVPSQGAPSLQELVVPCVDPFCVWCCFLINTTLTMNLNSGLRAIFAWNDNRAPTVALEVA
jgi:hypothetical protein